MKSKTVLSFTAETNSSILHMDESFNSIPWERRTLDQICVIIMPNSMSLIWLSYGGDYPPPVKLVSSGLQCGCSPFSIFFLPDRASSASDTRWRQRAAVALTVPPKPWRPGTVRGTHLCLYHSGDDSDKGGFRV